MFILLKQRNIAHKFYNQVIADLSVTSYGMSGNISSIIAHPYVFITMMTIIIAFSRKDQTASLKYGRNNPSGDIFFLLLLDVENGNSF